MLIERPPQWFRQLFPGAIFRMPVIKDCPPTIYLTFDDGPIPDVTPWVLDILDDYGVKATFFMVGQNVERHPELRMEVLKRGHAIGNHTHHHIRGFRVSPEDYLKDVETCEILTNSKLLRPPHGWLSPSQLREVKKHYKVVMYDLITRDYSKRVSAEKVFENVKKYTRNGSIIVFHDSLKSYDKLRSALPDSINWLKKQGFSFQTLNAISL